MCQSFLTPETTVRIERMNDHFTKYHLGGGRVLHHFTAAHDHDYHDHPFPFRSTILHGGYREELAEALPDGTLAVALIERPPGTSHEVAAGTIHKLVGLLASDCWTLIQVGEKEREPGFYRADEAGVWHRHWHEQDWRLLTPVIRLY